MWVVVSYHIHGLMTISRNYFTPVLAPGRKFRRPQQLCFEFQLNCKKPLWEHFFHTTSESIVPKSAKRILVWNFPTSSMSIDKTVLLLSFVADGSVEAHTLHVHSATMNETRCFLNLIQNIHWDANFGMLKRQQNIAFDHVASRTTILNIMFIQVTGKKLEIKYLPIRSSSIRPSVKKLWIEVHVWACIQWFQ